MAVNELEPIACSRRRRRRRRSRLTLFANNKWTRSICVNSMEITRRNTVLYIHCSRSGGATAERPQKRPEPSGRMVGCGGGQSVNKYTRACESCGQRVRARVVRKRDSALHYVFSASSSSLTHFLLYAGFNPSGLASAGVLGSHTAHMAYITH